MTQLTRETITLAYDPTYGWVSIVIDPDGTNPMLWLYTERTGEIRDTGGILAGLHPVIPPLDKGGSYREDQVYCWAGLDSSAQTEIKEVVSNIYDSLQGIQSADAFLFTLLKNRGEFETACAVVTLYNQKNGAVPVLRTLLQEEHTQISLGELLDYVKNNVAPGRWSYDIRQVADTIGHEDDTVPADVELRTLMAAEYLTLLQKVVKTGGKNGA